MAMSVKEIKACLIVEKCPANPRTQHFEGIYEEVCTPNTNISNHSPLPYAHKD